MTDDNLATQSIVNLTIDGLEVSVSKGTTVYTAAKSVGIDIPIFCYLDRMPPFGACRMCLVEVERMPKLQASCTLEAMEGMVVHTQTQNAIRGREGVLEFLLINHPLDCPICDRGGECPLQDQTLKHGPGTSRFVEEKRHFKKPVSLGPVLMLDRERCIICARCTRFSDLIAGDHALEFIERGYRTEVGTPNGSPVESKYIGNTIMICPVGALTSQVYRFRSRPWDNDCVSSTCTLCPIGCSMILDSRDGEIVRTRAEENRQVNDIWLCDKGWFGYEFTSHENRLTKPLIRRKGKLEEADWDEAISTIVETINESKTKNRFAAMGGSPLTFEENFLFQKLMRDVLGVPHLDHRVGQSLHCLDEEGFPPGMEITLQDCESLSYAILVGLDLTEEFPLVWLRLRQAINQGAKIFFVGHYAPEIAPYLQKIVLHSPGNEIDKIQEIFPLMLDLAAKGGKGALFVGRQYLASPNRQSVLYFLAEIKQKLAGLSLNILEGRGNSLGARLAGMHPEIGPLDGKIELKGLNYLQVLQTAATDGWDFLYIAGANPAQKISAKLWQEARANLKFLIVQDLFLTETANQADVVLPTLCFLEKQGSFINIEGRVQNLRPGKMIPKGIFSDGEIFSMLAEKLKHPISFEPYYSERINSGRILPKRKEKIDLVKKELQVCSDKQLKASFTHALFDQGIRMQHNPHLLEMAENSNVRIHPIEAKKRNLKTGDQVRLTVNGNSIKGKLILDDLVAEETLILPLGFKTVPVYELGANLLNGQPIEITLC
jgi:NADH-quinone oxidoreductase subunit G